MGSAADRRARAAVDEVVRVYAAAATYRDEGRIIEHYADRDVTFGTFRTGFERDAGRFSFELDINESRARARVSSDGDPFLELHPADDLPLPPVSSVADAIAMISGITMGAAYYVSSLLFRAGLGGKRWLDDGNEGPRLVAESSVDGAPVLEIALGHSVLDEHVVLDARTFAILRVLVPQEPLTEDQRRHYVEVGMPRPPDHAPVLSVIYEPTLE